MPKLFVLNGKKEDLVADVVLVSDSDVFSGINKLEKVVVTDYSREQIVLDSRSSDTLSANQKGRVLPTNTENSKKIAGFGAYLFDRRKAAVFTCGNVRYFILPSETKESSSNLQCIYLPKAEHKEQAKPISAQASVSAEKSVVHAAPMGSKTGGKGFLDSLIQTV